MGKIEVLRPVKGQSSSAMSPERQALAAAQERASAARTRFFELEQTVGHAEKMVAGAKGKLDHARQAVTEAKEGHAAMVAKAAAAGGQMSGFQAVRDARMHEGYAVDDLDAAQAALADLESQLSEARDGILRADGNVSAAAKGVIEADVPRLFEEAKELQEQLINARAGLCAIVRELGVTGPDAEALARFLRDTELPAGVGGVVFRDWGNHPSAIAWLDAYKALRDQPEAPLPG